MTLPVFITVIADHDKPQPSGCLLGAELGTQLNELESLDSLGSDRALGQTQQMSDLVDVDWNATISSYIMQQTALQASYKAFTDMQGLSLFQLNK